MATSDSVSSSDGVENESVIFIVVIVSFSGYSSTAGRAEKAQAPLPKPLIALYGVARITRARVISVAGVRGAIAVNFDHRPTHGNSCAIRIGE